MLLPNIQVPLSYLGTDSGWKRLGLSGLNTHLANPILASLADLIL